MIALSHPAFTRSGRKPALLRLLLTLEEWAERRRQRRALLALSNHALKDIGLNSADAWQEGHKSAWPRPNIDPGGEFARAQASSWSVAKRE